MRNEYMYSFRNDYSEGAHPDILKRLLDMNQCQNVGYGEDALCEHAKQMLKEKLQCEDCDIHFLVGGTQANLTVIDVYKRQMVTEEKTFVKKLVKKLTNANVGI